MLTIQPDNGFEKYLCDKAFAEAIPLSGTFELLPICNMDCRMCYIRLSQTEMNRLGKPLAVEEWVRIGKEATDKGCMFLLLTGGEPLLYPDFSRLYQELLSMGIIITLNTNGTLINTSLVELFRHNPPRRINISLYGSSDAVYTDLCRNPKGFTQVSQGIKMLLDADVQVKINFTPTPQNHLDMENVIQLTEEWGIPISMATYMFPPARKMKTGTETTRLSAKQAACEQLRIIQRAYSQEPDYKDRIKNILQDMQPREGKTEDIAPPGGLLCSAGVSSFWVNWKGDLTPCGMLQHPMHNLRKCTFAEGWEAIKKESRHIFTAKKCFNCRFRKVCQGCGAASFAENGDFSIPATYHCELNKEYERLLKQHLIDLETIAYENQ